MDKEKKIQEYREKKEMEGQKLKDRHYQEWWNLKKEERQALEAAKNPKKIRKEYQRRFDELDRRQTQEYISLQREFVEELKAIL